MGVAHRISTPSITQVQPPRVGGLITRIRLCLCLVMAGLVLCGVAASSPVRSTQSMLDLLVRSAHFGTGTPVYVWLFEVHRTLAAATVSTPFIAYATDLVALAHIMLALALVGPYRDPSRNQWVVSFALLCCAAVALLAFTAGPIRGIPLFWRLVDSSFAVLCALPLVLCRHYTHLLQHLDSNAERQRKRSLHRRRGHGKVRDGRSFS